MWFVTVFPQKILFNPVTSSLSMVGRLAGLEASTADMKACLCLPFCDCKWQVECLVPAPHPPHMSPGMHGARLWGAVGHVPSICVLLHRGGACKGRSRGVVA